MKRVGWLTLIFSGAIIVAFAQDKVHWLSFEEALAMQEQDGKKMVIDMYTDWCGWCKKMDQATFQNAQIASYLNDNYIAVKFNAEDKEDITFNGKTYKFVKSGRRGYHELAAELTKGNLGYPTVVFLDENRNVIQALRGYQGPQRFERIMAYFATNQYKTTPWNQFSESYKPMLHAIKN